jgi:nucleoside-triphosphatase THEP1
MIIIITGLPGTGKSTLLTKLIDHYSTNNIQYESIVVKERRDVHQNRSGFITVDTNGYEFMLASKEIIFCDTKIGSYYVNIPEIESYLIPRIRQMSTIKNKIIIYDEIGRMQNKALGFLEAIDNLLESDAIVIATVAFDTSDSSFDEFDWSAKYKDSTKYHVIELTHENRDILPIEIIKLTTLDVIFKKLLQ